MSREWSEHHKEVPDDFIKRVNESEHPEMQDIPADHEVMVVRFQGLRDELNNKLQDRIDELKKKEDEDNGDGGLVVRK